MYNAGWIDQPLDRWILERLARNDVAALEHLFTFDSDALRSGTGEVRAWISVAAALRRPATVVEYVPAHCTQTGCGFVYWPPAGAPIRRGAEPWPTWLRQMDDDTLDGTMLARSPVLPRSRHADARPHVEHEQRGSDELSEAA
jgi:hypothetical protein